MTVARNAGWDVPPGGPIGSAPATGIGAAPDPGGGAVSVTDAVQLLGLKLESRKAMIEQLIVDSRGKDANGEFRLCPRMIRLNQG